MPTQPALTLAPYIAASGTTVAIQAVGADGNPSNLQGLNGNTSQILEVDGAGGVFPLTFNGQTVTGIGPGALAATIASDLNGLSSIGGVGGSVSVQGSRPWLVTFGGTLGGIPQPLIITSAGSLSATGTPAGVTAGSGSPAFFDTSSSSFASVGQWTNGNPSFGHGLKCVATGTGLQQGEFTVTGLPIGTYSVAFSNDIFGGTGSGTAAAVPWRFYDGTTPIDKLLVNEQGIQYATAFSGSGAAFQPLKQVYVASGTLRILITDEVTGSDIGKLVVINQIHIAPVDPSPAVVYTINNAPNYVSRTGTWHSQSGDPAEWDGFLNYSDVPNSTYTSGFPGLMLGTYTAQVQYSVTSGRSTQASYQVFDGATLVGTVPINQNTAPAGLFATDDNSVSHRFVNLGNFPCTSGLLVIVLTCGSDSATAVTLSSAALVSLVSTTAYTESTSATVTLQSAGGPPAIKVNAGSSIPLPIANGLWDKDTFASPLITWALTGVTILPTDTVTLTVPANCFSLAAGLVPAITNQAVINRVGGTLCPPVPDTITLRAGWNVPPPEGTAPPIYSNLIKNCGGLNYNGSNSPIPLLTADLYPQSIAVDHWVLHVGNTPASPVDPRGYPRLPNGGPGTLRFDGAVLAYPQPVAQGGTTQRVVAIDCGHATRNTILFEVSISNPTTNYAPAFDLQLNGPNDYIDDLDTGRFLALGTWTLLNTGFNGGSHRNSKLTSDKAIYTAGTLPGGTYQIGATWVADPGNTTGALWTIKENGTTIATFGCDQTAAPRFHTIADLNGAQQLFEPASQSFTSSGGVITIELTGGTDGYCIADALWLILQGNLTSGIPFAPITKLEYFPPGVDPDGDKFHPNIKRILKGSRSLRSVTLMGANSASMVNYSDYATATQLCYGIGVRTNQYTVTQIETYGNPNGFFQGPWGTAKFTVTPLNGAPLPLTNGQTLALPGNITVNYASGGGSIFFSGVGGALEYDSSRMNPNQFAMGTGANSGSGALTTLNPAQPAIAATGFTSIPWADYFELCASIAGCAAWPNVTPVATQACVESIADAYMLAMPRGSRCYYECGNEPWNSAFGFPYFGCYYGYGATLGGGANAMLGYGYLATRQHTWFYNRLQTQGRGNELIRVFNCALDSPDTFVTVANYCDQHGFKIDRAMIAPYLQSGPLNVTGLGGLVSGYNAAQLADQCDAWAGLGNFYQPKLKGWQDLVASVGMSINQAIGLSGYEGGLATMNLGGNQATQEAQSFGSRYHPQVYKMGLGYLSMLQSYGMMEFNDYNLTQPATADFTAYRTSNYGKYWAFNATAGIGDGSDGLYDNRPDIAGVPPGVPNLLLDVSPWGAAMNFWNGASTSPIASTLPGSRYRPSQRYRHRSVYTR